MVEPADSIVRRPACPGCGTQLDPLDAGPSEIRTCPHCGHEFSASAAEPDAEFDRVRIRQVVALRRGLYRGRAYAVIAGLACTAGAGQCIYLAREQLRSAGASAFAFGFMALAVIAAAAAVWCVRRAHAFGQELRRSPLPDPSTPPDFSRLSDGSQHAQNLTDVS